MEKNLGFTVTQVGNGALLLEPYDNLDPSSDGDMLEEISYYIKESDIHTLFYDMNKIYISDKLYYQWLCRLSKICKLFCVKLKLIHMKPTAAISISSFIKGPPDFDIAMSMS